MMDFLIVRYLLKANMKVDGESSMKLNVSVKIEEVPLYQQMKLLNQT